MHPRLSPLPSSLFPRAHSVITEMTSQITYMTWQITHTHARAHARTRARTHARTHPYTHPRSTVRIPRSLSQCFLHKPTYMSVFPLSLTNGLSYFQIMTVRHLGPGSGIFARPLQVYDALYAPSGAPYRPLIPCFIATPANFKPPSTLMYCLSALTVSSMQNLLVSAGSDDGR